METWRIIVALTVVSAMVVIGIVALPYLTVKLTRAGRLLNFFLLFATLAITLNLFLPNIGIPLAFTIALIDYEKRGAKEAGKSAPRQTEPPASGDDPPQEP